MSLNSLAYTEYESEPQFWKLERCDFVQVNLIVGRNSTGKTRLINVISGLCKVLSGQRTTVFDSGTYLAEIDLDGSTYALELEFLRGEVVKESLTVDGLKRLVRASDGRGEIYYDQQGKFIEFQVPKTTIAIQQRQDELQHPFVVKLSTWAQSCQTYFFGSSLGKDLLVTLATLQASVGRQGKPNDNGDLVRRYINAFELHGDAFDAAVVRDMTALGYHLSDVSAEDMRPLSPGLVLPEPVLGMTVTEVGREAKLSQIQMSQGMFRALALIIYVNAASFSKQQALVLIDDIGEGLDYERSAGLIDVLIRHAKDSGFQVLMTSNDRFVMNRVPLAHWALLRRNGSIVKAYTERNSQKEFSEFKYMGLSNFDLFTSDVFQ